MANKKSPFAELLEENWNVPQDRQPRAVLISQEAPRDMLDLSVQATRAPKRPILKANKAEMEPGPMLKEDLQGNSTRISGQGAKLAQGVNAAWETKLDQPAKPAHEQ